jgi:hypothetical protein
MKLFLIALTVFFFVIPFGYWRANVNKFSLQWILAIHLPVPFIILLRIFSNIGFELYTYPILVGAFFLGQMAGKWFNQIIRNKNLLVITTSCLFVDLFRYWVSSERNQ